MNSDPAVKSTTFRSSPKQYNLCAVTKSKITGYYY